MSEFPKIGKLGSARAIVLIAIGLASISVALGASFLCGSDWWTNVLVAVGVIASFCEARTWKILEKLGSLIGADALARDLKNVLSQTDAVKKAVWHRWGSNLEAVAVALLCGALLCKIQDSTARIVLFSLGFGAVGTCIPIAFWLVKDYQSLDKFITDQLYQQTLNKERDAVLQRMRSAPAKDLMADPHLQGYGKVR